MEQYIKGKKDVQSALLEYIDNEINIEENYTNLVKILKDQKYQDDYSELKILLIMITKIANYHHRSANFYDKIIKIISLYKNDIIKLFSNTEIYQLFQDNNRLLLFLFEENMLKLTNTITRKIRMSQNDFYYFYPEMTSIDISNFPYFVNYFKTSPEEFKSKRKIGENDSYICELIRKDDIENFIIYINKNSISIDSYCESSIYETNAYLKRRINTFLFNNYIKETRLIEYAAFFGSVQIFKYLLLNGAKFEYDLMEYAFHGCSEEIIHILEDRNIKIDLNNFGISIQFFQSEITDYFLDNISLENANVSLEMNQSIEYFNFNYFPKETEIKNYVIDLVKYGYLKLVEMIYESSFIDLDSIFTDKMLFEILDSCNFDIFKLLYENKKSRFCSSWLNPFKCVQDIYIVLYIAIDKENVKAVDFLLSKHEIDINVYFNRNFMVSNNNYYNNLKVIQKYEIDSDRISFNGNEYITCLHLALEKKDNEIIQLLINYPKIDINMKIIELKGKTIKFKNKYSDSDSENDEERNGYIKIEIKKSPLLFLLEKNDYDNFELLLKNPSINVNEKSDYHYYYDFESIENGTQDVVQNKTILYSAIEYGDNKIAELLLSQPEIDVNLPSMIITDVDLEKSLYGIYDGNIDISDLDLLIPNIVEKTPLLLTLEKGNFEILTLLLSNQSIDPQSIKLLNPVLKSGNIVAFKTLLNHPEFISDDEFNDALNSAVIGKNVDIVKNILNRPNVNVNNVYNDMTPIQTAAYQGDLDIFKILLERPDIELNNQGYCNILHLAVMGRNVEIVKLLLERTDLDINAEYYGKTAFQIAAELGDVEIILAFLKRHDLIFDPNNIYPSTDVNKSKIVLLALSEKRKIENPEKKEMWDQLEEEFLFFIF